jgi:hypothetical protein
MPDRGSTLPLAWRVGSMIARRCCCWIGSAVSPGESWPVGFYRQTAERLGRAQASLLDERALSCDSLSNGFLRQYSSEKPVDWGLLVGSLLCYQSVAVGPRCLALGCGGLAKRQLSGSSGRWGEAPGREKTSFRPPTVLAAIRTGDLLSAETKPAPIRVLAASQLTIRSSGSPRGRGAASPTSPFEQPWAGSCFRLRPGPSGS